MKEVTGELNLTVIVAIAVGILIAFFFTFMWPALNANFTRTSQCKKATCDCTNAKENGYLCYCHVGESDACGANGPEGDNCFTCPFGG